MNKLQKFELYDRLSKLLTEYEFDESIPEYLRSITKDDFYEMLKEIHGKWGELTN